jgi:hypothetical protein
MGDTDIPKEGSLIDRVKESPRTVSALIIILIVAAAIYAFSGEEDNQEAAMVDDEGIPVTEEGTAAETMQEREGQVAGDGMEEGEGTAMSEEVELPQARRTGEGYVEVAQAGDGYTHLARRAATKWLSENQADYAVTDEHRIYIEDYIQNQLGSSGLALGESQTITFDLIQEAVVAAGGLNDAQLQNLSQYTHVLQ